MNNTRSIAYIKRLRAEIHDLEHRVHRLKFALGITIGVLVLLGFMWMQA